MSFAESGVYKLSGKLGLGAVVVPLGAFVATIVLSIVYAYVNVYSPIAGWISFVFVAGFAVLVGGSIGGLGYLSRCRNARFLTLTGVVTGLFAIYAAWAAFEYVLLARYSVGFAASLFDVYLSPEGVWEMAQAINQDGWYSILGATPSGIVLWALWGIEGLIVLAASSILAASFVESSVFCEHCGRWCKEEEGTTYLMLPDDEKHFSDFVPGNIDPLLALALWDDISQPSIRVDLWECGKCQKTSALQAKLFQMTVDSDGKMEKNADDLIPIWSMSQEAITRIKKHLALAPHSESSDVGPSDE